MNINLHNKSFLTLLDFSKEEIIYLLDLSVHLKIKRQLGIPGNSLSSKNIALLFEKPSTRTRCAFEIAIVEEGGYPSFIDIASTQFSKKESIKDSAQIFSSYYHALEFRGYSQQTVEELAKFAGVPVYNGLTDEDHPTQILADLLTIRECVPHKDLSEIKIAYVGDTRNNIANAWIYAAAELGMHFVGFGPEELHPTAETLAKAEKFASNSNAKIELSNNPKSLLHADVIYTDVWTSMGEEHDILKRVQLLQNYKVTSELLKLTQNPNVLFMHCLPALHNGATTVEQNANKQFGIAIQEVSDEVFTSKNSVVFQQAANRLHTIKAILVATLAAPEIVNEQFNIGKEKQDGILNKTNPE